MPNTQSPLDSIAAYIVNSYREKDAAINDLKGKYTALQSDYAILQDKYAQSLSVDALEDAELKSAKAELESTKKKAADDLAAVEALGQDQRNQLEELNGRLDAFAKQIGASTTVPLGDIPSTRIDSPETTVRSTPTEVPVEVPVPVEAPLVDPVVGTAPVFDGSFAELNPPVPTIGLVDPVVDAEVSGETIIEDSPSIPDAPASVEPYGDDRF